MKKYIVLTAILVISSFNIWAQATNIVKEPNIGKFEINGIEHEILVYPYQDKNQKIYRIFIDQTSTCKEVTVMYGGHDFHIKTGQSKDISINDGDLEVYIKGNGTGLKATGSYELVR